MYFYKCMFGAIWWLQAPELKDLKQYPGAWCMKQNSCHNITWTGWWDNEGVWKHMAHVCEIYIFAKTLKPPCPVTPSMNATLQHAGRCCILLVFFCKLLLRLRRVRLLCKRELERSRQWQNSWVTVGVAKYRTKATVVHTGICHPPSPVGTTANGWATPDCVAVLFKPEHENLCGTLWLLRGLKQKKREKKKVMNSSGSHVFKNK